MVNASILNVFLSSALQYFSKGLLWEQVFSSVASLLFDFFMFLVCVMRNNYRIRMLNKNQQRGDYIRIKSVVLFRKQS